MNKCLSGIGILAVTILCFSCSLSQKREMSVIIKNNSKSGIFDYPVFIEWDSIKKWDKDIGPSGLSVIVNGDKVPFQLTKNSEYIVVNVDIPAESDLKIIFKCEEGLNKEWKKRTHAELSHKTGGKFINKIYEGGGLFVSVGSLRVPAECTDHSLFIKYEGPGWESDKVGYRFYLDWRNAVDIYGKLADSIVLPGVGLDGYESYHSMADWGMDILKVGGSLGIGTIATWNGKQAERVEKTDSVICKIIDDGILYSSIETGYFGWKSSNGKVNLNSRISINAGSRLTKCELKTDGEIKNIATGIVKNDSISLIKGPADTEWGYIATWGLQSLNNDSLGMVIFFKNTDVTQIAQDDLSYVVVFKPGAIIEYYFGAMWEKENNNNFSKKSFDDYLDDEINRLNNPVVINW